MTSTAFVIIAATVSFGAVVAIVIAGFGLATYFASGANLKDDEL